MSTDRPFRFAAGAGRITTPEEWLARVRQLEHLGYSTVELGQHLAGGSPGQFAALATAAASTTSLRIATHVIPDDLYRPAMLALEAATLDLLSGGRLELGLGAGWHRPDYELAGLAFEPAGVRVSRFTEALRLVKTLLRGEASAPGVHFPAMGPLPGARPAQRPHPPIFVGGGRRRILTLAARGADIVGLDLSSTPQGAMDLGSLTAERVAERVSWVRQAAAERFDALELHVLTHGVVVSDDRERGARLVADRLGRFPSTIAQPAELSLQHLLDSPHVLVGSVERLADTLRERRERFGISYYTISAAAIEDFAPVIARLAGT
jgi:probable F420-dependent oxidoreductase